MIHNHELFEVADFPSLRAERQKDNYVAVTESGWEDINQKALERAVVNIGLSVEELKEKAERDVHFQRAMEIILAKNSSRQGTKDEHTIINGVANALRPYGVNIEALGVNALVPIRNSCLVVPRKQAKNDFDKKDLLKSFDFCGSVEKTNQQIFGFAKVVLGNGGHQDNVFHEAREVIEWARQYGDKDALYVFMIDTDDALKFEDFKKLENGGGENIWVVNHKTFQKRILNLLGL
jgi:hypothetical protein